MTAEQPPEVDEVTPGGLEEIAARRRRFAELTAKKKEIAADARKVQKELDKIEPQILEDYGELGTDSMRVTLGEGEGAKRYTVHLATEVFARPKKSGINDKGDDASTEEDWAKACDALRVLGLADMLGERFNAQSFGAWIREFRKEAGPEWQEELPAEVMEALDIGTRQRVRVRAS